MSRCNTPECHLLYWIILEKHAASTALPPPSQPQTRRPPDEQLVGKRVRLTGYPVARFNGRLGTITGIRGAEYTVHMDAGYGEMLDPSFLCVLHQES